MRSIGKVKTRKLRELCARIIKEETAPDLFTASSNGVNFFGRSFNWPAISEKIHDAVPVDYFDTWECAWSEIERIIHDEISRAQYGRKDGAR